MLSRKHRFIGSKEIPAILRRGRHIGGEGFSLKLAPNSRAQLRVAIVVSKKTAKHAVVRNRIRRRIYSFFRQHLPDFTGSYDIVVLVRDEGLAKADWKIIEARLLAACQQAGVIV